MSLSERGFFYEKRAAKCSGGHTALFQTRISILIPKGETMVLFFPVVLKSLFQKGRKYPWPRPQGCPRCGSAYVWGHGFADAFFDGFDQPLLLKLYRCPDCGCVIRLRPEGYFNRFQAPIATIRSSIARKSTSNGWLPGISRTRQCHWYRSLCKRIKVYLTDTWCQGVLAGFDTLLRIGQSPVSRSI